MSIPPNPSTNGNLATSPGNWIDAVNGTHLTNPATDGIANAAPAGGTGQASSKANAQGAGAASCKVNQGKQVKQVNQGNCPLGFNI